MSSQRLISLLDKSVAEFNQWRSDNPNEQPDLIGAILVGANLREANLTGAFMSAAILSEARLNGADLSEARLDGADLIGADLMGANLREAHLTEADLTGAFLMGANLSGANLNGAYLPGANLSGANLSGAHWDEQTVWPEDFEPPDLPGEPDNSAPAIGVVPLERSRHFPDEQAHGTVLQAVESLLGALAEYRDPERSPLKPDEWAQLDASCSTLESQLRHPTGNPLIVNAAADDALAAVRPYLDLEEDASPEVLELLEVAEGIGNEDPVEAGDHAEEVLDRAVTTPPTDDFSEELTDDSAEESTDDDPSEEPTKKFGDRAGETAREAALRGVDSGVEEAVRNLITGTPHAVAAAVTALGLWAYGGVTGAAVGVAWAIIRIVIGSFKRRSK